MKGSKWKLPARPAHRRQNEEWLEKPNGEMEGRSVTLDLPYREERVFTVLGARKETDHVWALEEGIDVAHATVLFTPEDFKTKGRLTPA